MSNLDSLSLICFETLEDLRLKSDIHFIFSMRKQVIPANVQDFWFIMLQTTVFVIMIIKITTNTSLQKQEA